jgi:hypothetical protein
MVPNVGPKLSLPKEMLRGCAVVSPMDVAVILRSMDGYWAFPGAAGGYDVPIETTTVQCESDEL